MSRSRFRRATFTSATALVALAGPLLAACGPDSTSVTPVVAVVQARAAALSQVADAQHWNAVWRWQIAVDPAVSPAERASLGSNLTAVDGWLTAIRARLARDATLTSVNQDVAALQGLRVFTIVLPRASHVLSADDQLAATQQERTQLAQLTSAISAAVAAGQTMGAAQGHLQAATGALSAATAAAGQARSSALSLTVAGYPGNAPALATQTTLVATATERTAFARSEIAAGLLAVSTRTNDVVDENSRPGTPGWQLTRLGAGHEIEGWGSRTSVLAGQSLDLHVSTTAAAWTVHAIRVGWYGGLLGRQVWASSAQRGVVQAPASVVGPLHTVVTDWPSSLTLSTTGWPAGNYLLRLDAASGAQRYVPLQVRRPSAQGAVVVVSSDTTAQAYNAYGGYSLYQGPDGTYATRSRAVSFDRPLDGNGASEYFGYARPLVSLAEKLGLELDYVSDTDLDTDPHLLDGARAVVMTGHDEYWSLAMRQAMLSARDRGINLGFLGANNGYRHIRLQPNVTGPDRVEVCYKDPTEDPLTATNPADTTGQWRNAPDPRPESAIVGGTYVGYFHEGSLPSADLVVVDPSNWLFAGTAATAGMVLPRMVSIEFDRVDLSSPTPRPIEVLTHSPVVMEGQRTFSDSAFYSTPSGAGVFDAGSIGWISGLTDYDGPVSKAFATKVTTNLLEAIAAGPAGRAHPARDNTASVYPG